MASMNNKNYYSVLGVSHDATDEQIRKTFQQKARKLHPDVNKSPDAEKQFKEVSEAYAVLSDPEKRRRYDAMRSGNPFVSSYGASSTPQGDPFEGMGDPFSWGFPFRGSGFRTSRHSRAYNPQVGGDVVYQLGLDASSAATGCTRGVTYQRYVACNRCHGSGSVHTEDSKTCPTCAGSGHISVDLGSFFGIGVMNMTCPECEGVGQVIADPCETCCGSGRVLSASEVVIEVPANSHDGDVIRIKSMGNAGTNGSSSGDFVCRVSVASERLNQRQAQGFQMIGFGLPFVLVGALFGFNVLSSLAVIITVPILLGIWLIISSKAKLGTSKYWWKNAVRYLVSGMSSGLTIAVFFSVMVSCMSGFGTAGYRGK